MQILLTQPKNNKKVMETFDTGARLAVLENEVKNIAIDIKEIRKESKDQHGLLMKKMEQIEERVDIIEKWRWMLIGGAGVAGYIVGFLFTK